MAMPSDFNQAALPFGLLILLTIPEKERERFIAEMDIENMSVRELQKAVNTS
jgi:hypothetical protein